jgi:hypothetical protein
MLGRQRLWRMGGVVAEVKEEVYGHNHEKHTKHDDGHIEDIE